MTPIRKTFTGLFIAGCLINSGCSLQQMVKMSKDQKLTVNPSPLEVHGDSVRFSVAAELPVKMLKKNKIYTANLAYKYKDQSINVGEIQFKAADFPNAKTTSPQITKNFSFGYNPSIGNGDLVAVGNASNLQMSKTKSTPELPIAKGLVTTSNLVKDIYNVSYAEHGYNNKEELVPTKLEFYFPQGSSQVQVKESKGSKGRFLDNFLVKKNVTRTVRIVGEHSPEGSETANSKLSEARAKSIEKFYKDKMKRLKQKPDSIEFVTKGIVQDWTGLKTILDTTDIISADQEAQILSIINGAGTFEEKEKQLQPLPSYSTLSNKVYPMLRTARTEILTVKPKKTDAQILELAKGISTGSVTADTLNDQELSFAATLTPSLEEKEAIFVAATKKNDSWASHNNLGAVYLLKAVKAGEKEEKAKFIEMAENQFNIALKGNNNAEAHNNLAVVHLMRGARGMALEEVNKAAQLPTNDSLMKGIMSTKGLLQIKEGKYDEAIESLSKAGETSDNIFNLALANLLKKNFDAAKSGFETVNKMAPNDAWGFYANAVTAANLNDVAAMNDKLKQAVQLNNQLGEKATVDLEFIKYWDSPEFKVAIK